MAAQDTIIIGLTVLGMVVPPGTLWLRLQYRLRRERERSDYLRVAATLPPGSRVQEQRDDGTRLTVDVGMATRDGSL